VALSNKPDVVLFMTDQQRRDWFGCYGNPVIKTPNFGKLAREASLSPGQERGPETVSRGARAG